MAQLVSGAQGGIALPSGVTGDNIVVFSWSGSLEHEKFDSTPFGDGTATATNYKTKSYGMYHLTGTCEGWMLDSAVPSIGTAATVNASPVAAFRLLTTSHTTPGTRKGYSFAAVVSSMSMTVEQTGQARVSLSFESSGPVTIIADS